MSGVPPSAFSEPRIDQATLQSGYQFIAVERYQRPFCRILVCCTELPAILSKLRGQQDTVVRSTPARLKRAESKSQTFDRSEVGPMNKIDTFVALLDSQDRQAQIHARNDLMPLMMRSDDVRRNAFLAALLDRRPQCNLAYPVLHDLYSIIVASIRSAHLHRDFRAVYSFMELAQIFTCVPPEKPLANAALSLSGSSSAECAYQSLFLSADLRTQDSFRSNSYWELVFADSLVLMDLVPLDQTVLAPPPNGPNSMARLIQLVISIGQFETNFSVISLMLFWGIGQ